jgi:N-acylneuraminate cytidylyltransferase/CMP-N,N'-diacetyllegionaminic acid synthase
MMRLCTVCARGGSKGVTNKNIRLLRGRPLIQHTILQAIQSDLFDDIAVSSDSEEILEAARAAGATHLIVRPAELASDASDKSPAIVHCGREVERLTGKVFETFVDLDASAPLRTIRHIKEAVALLESGDVSNVFTVCHSRRNPYFNMVEVSVDGHPRLSKTIDPPPVRRQDTPEVYDMNASIYVWRRHEYFALGAPVLANKTEMYVMPEFTAFDLDSEFDFAVIEAVFPRMSEFDHE